MFKYFGLVLYVLAVSRGAPVTDGQSNANSESAYATSMIKLNRLENEMLPSEECTEEKIVLTFKLYTRENPNGQRIDPKNIGTLKNSSFNVKDDTKIVIHDWLQNETHSYNKDFVSAFLKNKKERVNVITVDYGSVSRCDVYTILSMQPVIGEKLGEMINSLIQYGTVAPKTHLIGFGMGAQIAGYAARQIHPRKVARLTALDPTFVGYMEGKPQLQSSDSDYMDVIHTAQRKFGSVNNLGNARFYPNGGSRQPIAKNSSNETEASILSHLASVFYYLESILDNNYFKARLCQNYMELLGEKCSEPAVYNNMGDEPNITLSGDFYLKTDFALPPFTQRACPVNVYELRRQMEIKVREVKTVDAAEAAVAKQTYENKKISEQPISEEEIKKIYNQFSSKAN